MNDSILDAVPRGLPPVERAHRLQQEAAGAGFDWPDADSMLDKVREELDELADACRARDADSLHEEIGDLLFVLVNLARFEGLRAEDCLSRACEKFERRFRAMEEALRRTGGKVQAQTPEALEALWQDAKRGERRG